MKRFKSVQQAQLFLSVHDQVANLFHIPYLNPSLPASAALPASGPSRSGARSLEQALRPDLILQTIAILSVQRSQVDGAQPVPRSPHRQPKTARLRIRRLGTAAKQFRHIHQLDVHPGKARAKMARAYPTPINES
jgi:hypothetical protein